MQSTEVPPSILLTIKREKVIPFLHLLDCLKEALALNVFFAWQLQIPVQATEDHHTVQGCTEFLK